MQTEMLKRNTTDVTQNYTKQLELIRGDMESIKLSLFESEETNRELGKTNQNLDRQVRDLTWEVSDKTKAMLVQTNNNTEVLEKKKVEVDQLRDMREKRENALILHVNTLESQVLDLNSQVESLKHLCEDKIEERRMIVELLEKERLETLENEDKLAGQIRDASSHIEHVKDDYSNQVSSIKFSHTAADP
jgi:hypothetical protein